MSHPIQLIAYSYNDVIKNSVVLKKSTLEYHMWIYLETSPDLDDCVIFNVTELNHEDDICVMDSAFVRESTCWIKVTTDLIDKSPGLHIYRIQFINRNTDDIFSKYIAYTIQDDNPEKRYIYMHNNERN